ncbi:hypothetical protein [Microvirga tunisiensis]|uniref:Uncharacterized protein n=1 Tax=Microvirga tunisiensis TaxID=2108360 RepID=A0A5N7MBX5_9HYPH|nr:hypothetical protein [Microvirga tunisiensis]MPR05549.1 hypothetical protein [Microvirga tunisiensis]MPR23749.1 hypothetical protein [Microvirga tunisiensis]
MSQYYVAVQYDSETLAPARILGAGRTESEAIDDAVSDIANEFDREFFAGVFSEGDHGTEPCTEVIFNEFRKSGEPKEFGVTKDRIVCTKREKDELELATATERKI